jgi:predicted DNA binding CopG/RHH family protein
MSRKKRNSRPRTVDPAGKRQGDRLLAARVTAAQLRQVKAKAKREGVPVSVLVRRVVLREVQAA